MTEGQLFMVAQIAYYKRHADEQTLTLEWTITATANWVNTHTSHTQTRKEMQARKDRTQNREDKGASDREEEEEEETNPTTTRFPRYGEDSRQENVEREKLRS